jgi:hypothetical protein
MMMMMMIKYDRCSKKCTAMNPFELVGYVRQIITSSRDARTIHIVCDSDAQRVNFSQRQLDTT